MPISINIKSDLSISADVGARNMLSSFSSRSYGGSTRSLYGAIENYRSHQTKIGQLQFPQDRPKFYTQIGIQTYDRRDMMTVNASLDTNKQLILPVPHGLTDGHGVSYNERESFGPLLGMAMHKGLGPIKDGAKNVASGQQSITDAGKDVMSQLGTPENLGDIAGAGAAELASGTVANVFQAAAGLSPNEFFTVLMKGPDYKRHQMVWHLNPRNPQESRTIKYIIAELNNAMAPGLLLGGALFNFPKVFSIAFMPNYNYLFKFKPCVLERMQTEYAPNGVPSFYHKYNSAEGNSPPESVRITCQFLELEYWLHSDFKPDASHPLDVRGTRESRESENTVVDPLREPIANAIQTGFESTVQTMDPAIRSLQGAAGRIINRNAQ